MQQLRSHHRFSATLAFLCSAFFMALPAGAQEGSSGRNQNTMTGTVVSSSRNTLTVRSTDGQFQLFTYDRRATRPANLTNGARVEVSSTSGDEPGVRVANQVTVLSAAAGGQGESGTQPVVPPELRRIESQIERQAKRFQTGVRAGVGLDPEVILLGVHAQGGPFFHPDVFLRPNVEFAFGEVTALFALNLEAIYRLPVSSRQGRWSTYVGVGPGFNFVHQNFERSAGENGGDRIDFGDFHSDVGLNILGGIRYRSGMFLELKTSVYSDTTPTLRAIVGYNF